MPADNQRTVLLGSAARTRVHRRQGRHGRGAECGRLGGSLSRSRTRCRVVRAAGARAGVRGWRTVHEGAAEPAERRGGRGVVVDAPARSWCTRRLAGVRAQGRRTDRGRGTGCRCHCPGGHSRHDNSRSLPRSALAFSAVTDLRHPIFRPFGSLTANLGQVAFTRAWRLPAAGWEIAASFTDGAPALMERREGDGRVLCFASDLDWRWNDFPLHPAFVPFVVESVRYAAARDGSGPRADDRRGTCRRAVDPGCARAAGRPPGRAQRRYQRVVSVPDHAPRILRICSNEWTPHRPGPPASGLS